MNLLTNEEKKARREKRMEHFGRFMDEFLVFFNLHPENRLQIVYEQRANASFRRIFMSPGQKFQLSIQEDSYGFHLSLYVPGKSDRFKKIASEKMKAIFIDFLQQKKVDCLVYNSTGSIKRGHRFHNNCSYTGKKSEHLYSLVKELPFIRIPHLYYGGSLEFAASLNLRLGKITITNRNNRHEELVKIQNIQQAKDAKRYLIESCIACDYLFSHTMKTLEKIDPTSYYIPFHQEFHCRDQVFHFKFSPILTPTGYMIDVLIGKKRSKAKNIQAAQALIQDALNVPFDQHVSAGTFTNKLLYQTCSTYRHSSERSMCVGPFYYEYAYNGETNEEMEKIAQTLLCKKKKNLTFALRDNLMEHIKRSRKNHHHYYLAFQVGDYVLVTYPKLRYGGRTPNKCDILPFAQYKQWVEKEKKRLRLLSLFEK